MKRLMAILLGVLVVLGVAGAAFAEVSCELNGQHHASQGF